MNTTCPLNQKNEALSHSQAPDKEIRKNKIVQATPKEALGGVKDGFGKWLYHTNVSGVMYEYATNPIRFMTKNKKKK